MRKVILGFVIGWLKRDKGEVVANNNQNFDKLSDFNDFEVDSSVVPLPRFAENVVADYGGDEFARCELSEQYNSYERLRTNLFGSLMSVGTNSSNIHLVIPKALKKYNDGIRDLILDKVKEVQKSLGETPCDYAILSLGSLAKGEMMPGSSFEFAILLDRKLKVGSSTDRYFVKFTKKIKDSLEPEISFDELGTNPLGYNRKNMLIGDRRQLLKYQDFKFWKGREETHQENRHLAVMMGTPTLLYLSSPNMEIQYYRYISEMRGKFTNSKSKVTKSLANIVDGYDTVTQRFSDQTDMSVIASRLLDHLDLFHTLEFANGEVRNAATRVNKLKEKTSVIIETYGDRIVSSCDKAAYLHLIHSFASSDFKDRSSTEHFFVKQVKQELYRDIKEICSYIDVFCREYVVEESPFYLNSLIGKAEEYHRKSWLSKKQAEKEETSQRRKEIYTRSLMELEHPTVKRTYHYYHLRSQLEAALEREKLQQDRDYTKILNTLKEGERLLDQEDYILQAKHRRKLGFYYKEQQDVQMAKISYLGALDAICLLDSFGVDKDIPKVLLIKILSELGDMELSDVDVKMISGNLTNIHDRHWSDFLDLGKEDTPKNLSQFLFNIAVSIDNIQVRDEISRGYINDKKFNSEIDKAVIIQPDSYAGRFYNLDYSILYSLLTISTSAVVGLSIVSMARRNSESGKIKTDETIFIEAIDSENWAKVKDFIERNIVDVDEDALGYKAIYAAARCKKWEMVKWLADHGVGVDAEDVYSEKLFHEAARFGKRDIIESFIAKSKNYDVVKGYLESSLHEAAIFREWDIVKWLITERKVNINIVNGYGETILYEAVTSRNLSIVKWLVDEQGVDVNVKNIFGQTAYDEALTSDVKQYLGGKMDEKNTRARSRISLSKDAILDKNYTGDITYSTWLTPKRSFLNYNSREEEWKDINESVEKGVGVNLKTPSGRILLEDLLLKFRHKEDVTTLICKIIGSSISGGFNLNSRYKNQKIFVDYLLERLGFREQFFTCLKFCIEHGADLSREYEGFATFLHYLLDQDIERYVYKDVLDFDDEILAVVEIAIKRGFSVNKQGKNGQTFLHYAAKAGYFGIVNTLLDSDKVDINIRDFSGRTFLHCLFNRGLRGYHDRYEKRYKLKYTEVEIGYTLIDEIISIVNKSFQKGCDLNARDEKGKEIFDLIVGCDLRDYSKLKTQRHNRHFNPKISSLSRGLPMKDNDNDYLRLRIATNKAVKDFLNKLDEKYFLRYKEIEQKKDLRTKIKKSDERTKKFIEIFGKFKLQKQSIKTNELSSQSDDGKKISSSTSSNLMLSIKDHGYEYDDARLVPLISTQMQTIIHNTVHNTGCIKSKTLSEEESLSEKSIVELKDGVAKGLYQDMQFSGIGTFLHFLLYNYPFSAEMIELLKISIEKDHDVHYDDYYKGTFLHYLLAKDVDRYRSSKGKNITDFDDEILIIVRTSIDKGFNVNERYAQGESFLHYAAHLGYFELVDYLTTYQGVNINLLDSSGKTFLHHLFDRRVYEYRYCYKYGGLDRDGDVFSRNIFNMIKRIVEKGFNIALKDNDGRTVIDVIISCILRDKEKLEDKDDVISFDMSGDDNYASENRMHGAEFVPSADAKGHLRFRITSNMAVVEYLMEQISSKVVKESYTIDDDVQGVPNFLDCNSNYSLHRELRDNTFNDKFGSVFESDNKMSQNSSFRLITSAQGYPTRKRSNSH